MKLRHRQIRRTTLRRPFRGLNRSSLRGRRRGPDDFAQMLTAFGRAIRAHRRLARLAPRFFDAAVIDRERENRAEQRRWMAMWEPLLAKAYGVAPEPVADPIAWPPLPTPATQRAVDRQLAELQLWLTAAHAAGERQRQRRPHALPTLTQLARLLQLAFDLKKMVLGLDSKNPLPEKITYDYEFTDLKRSYGHLLDPASPVVAAATGEPVPGGAPGVSADAAIQTPPPAPPASSASPADSNVLLPPAPPRCDAWSRWERQLRRQSR
jgi:hypothetical protein